MISLIPSPTAFIPLGGYSENIKITEQLDSSLKTEEYRIDIRNEKAEIVAGADAGFYYARLTLKQLTANNGGKIPNCYIADTPRFGYRGFMIDCARHMFSVSELKRIIEKASQVKLNVFHWHLSDDQGFRIALDSFPELTRKSTIRACDNFGRHLQNPKPYGGYYTKDEIREIIAFCKKRFITVIPEIDLPGHTSAILHAFPEFTCKGHPVAVKTSQGIYKDIFCAGNEKCYDFLQTMLRELCQLFDSGYFHIGGDEAPKANWQECELCKAKLKENGLSDFNDLQCYFANRIADILTANNKKVIVWNDILKGDGLNKDIIVQRWMDVKGRSAKAANTGRKMIASDFSPYYFDYPYEFYPLKKVFAYNPLKKGYSEKGRGNVLGIEAPVWTEYVNTDERLEFLLFPRLFAVAQNAWSENGDYTTFYTALKGLTQGMKKQGMMYADGKKANPPIYKRFTEILKFYYKMIPTLKID